MRIKRGGSRWGLPGCLTTADMKRSVPLRIAIRYLFGPKSHSAVNAIALVSLCGIAVATAAIVCVLSVFNGFRDLLGGKLEALSPDIELSAAHGRAMENGDSILEATRETPGVLLAEPMVADQALALLGTREMPVRLLGVRPSQWRKTVQLDPMLIEGSEPLADPVEGEMGAATLSVGVASQLGLVATGEKLMLFAPRRHGRINLANPAASFCVDSVEVTGVYRTNQREFDEDVVVTDLERARELLQYDDGELTSVGVTLRPGADVEAVAATLRESLGDGVRVRDRLQQHEMNFRMVNIEKWVTFLLLSFILAIASFNVISTVSMLVLEKRDSLQLLAAVGMERRKVGRVFAWESWLVTLGGGVSGVIVGAVLSLCQEKWGWIKLNGDPGSLVMDSYPVALQWVDLPTALAPLLVVGWVCAAVASRYARRLVGC